MAIGAGAVQSAAAAAERSSAEQSQRREFVAVGKPAATGKDGGAEYLGLTRGSTGGAERASAIEVLRAELGDSVRVVNERLAYRGQSLDIGVDPSTGSVVVKVSDDKTGEVVRQIPSEEMLRVARNIEALTGILVDHRE